MDFPSKCNGGEFYSEEDDLCISCFCMGIPSDVLGTPTQCQSSNMFRNVEKVKFYDETFGFTLTDENFAQEIPDLKIDVASREMYFDEMDNLEPNVYFWRLPAQFTGNQLGSYGGSLNFTLRVIPDYDFTDGALVILKVNSIL